MALSKVTIKKLLAIKQAILDQPEMYNQNEPPNYAYTCLGGCGAPCCFLGWALWLDNPSPKAYARRVHYVQQEDFVNLLGVTPDQAGRLFSVGYFDGENYIAVGNNAQLGAARIDHFIATGGAQ